MDSSTTAGSGPAGGDMGERSQPPPFLFRDEQDRNFNPNDLGSLLSFEWARPAPMAQMTRKKTLPIAPAQAPPEPGKNAAFKFNHPPFTTADTPGSGFIQNTNTAKETDRHLGAATPPRITTNMTSLAPPQPTVSPHFFNPRMSEKNNVTGPNRPNLASVLGAPPAKELWASTRDESLMLLDKQHPVSNPLVHHQSPTVRSTVYSPTTTNSKPAVKDHTSSPPCGTSRPRSQQKPPPVMDLQCTPSPYFKQKHLLRQQAKEMPKVIDPGSPLPTLLDRSDSRISNMSIKRAPQQHLKAQWLNPTECFQQFGMSWNEFHDRIQSELARRATSLEAAEEQISKLEKDKSKLRKKNAELINDLERYEAEISKLQGAVKEAHEDSQSKLQVIQEENRTLQNDKLSMAERENHLSKEIDNLKHEKQALEVQLDQNQHKVSACQEKVRKYREHINTILDDFRVDLDNAKQYADAMREAVMEEKSMAQAAVEDAWKAGEKQREALTNINKAAISILKQQQQEASITISGLEKRLELMEQDLERERQRADTFQKKVIDREQDETLLRAVTETAGDLARQLAHSRESFGSNAAFPETDEKKSQQLDHTITRLEAMTSGLASLPQSIKLLSDVHETHLSSVLHKISDLNASYSGAENNVKGLAAEVGGIVQKLVGEVERARSEIQHVRQQQQNAQHIVEMLATKEAECAERSSELAKAQVKVTELEDSLHQLELRNKELEGSLRVNHISEDSIASIRKQLNVATEALQEKSVALQRAQDQLKAASEASVKVAADANAELQRLREQLKEAHESRKAVEKKHEVELAEAKTRSQDYTKSHKQETQEILRIHKQQVEALQKRLAEVSKDLGVLTAQKEAADCRVQETTTQLGKMRSTHLKLEEKFRKLSIEKSNVDEELAGVRRAHMLLEEELKITRNDTANKEKSRNAETEKLKTQLAKSEAELTKAKSLANDVVKKSEIKLHEISSALEKECQLSKSKQEAMQQDLKKLQEQLETHQRSLKAQESKYDEQCCKTEDFSRKIAALEKTLASKNLELETLAAASAEKKKGLVDALSSQSKIASTVRWDIKTLIPLNNWKKWADFVGSFLLKHGGKLDPGERADIDPHVQEVELEMPILNDKLYQAFAQVEAIVAKEKWRKLDPFYETIDMSRQVIVRSPAGFKTPVYEPLSVEAEKEKRRLCHQPLSILKNRLPPHEPEAGAIAISEKLGQAVTHQPQRQFLPVSSRLSRLGTESEIGSNTAVVRKRTHSFSELDDDSSTKKVRSQLTEKRSQPSTSQPGPSDNSRKANGMANTMINQVSQPRGFSTDANRSFDTKLGLGTNSYGPSSHAAASLPSSSMVVPSSSQTGGLLSRLAMARGRSSEPSRTMRSFHQARKTDLPIGDEIVSSSQVTIDNQPHHTSASTSSLSEVDTPSKKSNNVVRL